LAIVALAQTKNRAMGVRKMPAILRGDEAHDLRDTSPARERRI
jgi:hypothetical protein